MRWVCAGLITLENNRSLVWVWGWCLFLGARAHWDVMRCIQFGSLSFRSWDFPSCMCEGPFAPDRSVTKTLSFWVTAEHEKKKKRLTEENSDVRKSLHFYLRGIEPALLKRLFFDWHFVNRRTFFSDCNLSFMLHAVLVADLWKLGHHNPDQVMSAYCCTEPPLPRSRCNRFLQFGKSCLTPWQIL